MFILLVLRYLSINPVQVVLAKGHPGPIREEYCQYRHHVIKKLQSGRGVTCTIYLMTIIHHLGKQKIFQASLQELLMTFLAGQ